MDFPKVEVVFDNEIICVKEIDVPEGVEPVVIYLTRHDIKSIHEDGQHSYLQLTEAASKIVSQAMADAALKRALR